MKKSKYPEPRKWTPKNPQKYDGNVNSIIARSSWEIRFFNWADSNPNVLSWSSEETIIPYISPVDLKPHRYFMDGKIKVKTATGVQVYLIEIKPAVQTQIPKPSKRKTQGFLNECKTYAVNSAKWAAADRWAKDRGWIFKILTEYDLGIAKRK